MYLDGQPQGVATVLEQGRQRHLAVQRLATDPPDPPRPKSSLDYLAALRAEHQAQLQKELGRLTFARLTPPEAGASAGKAEPRAPMEK